LSVTEPTVKLSPDVIETVYVPACAMTASSLELFGTPADQSLASDQSPLVETFQLDVVIPYPALAI
jgi:hypothetical protein